MLVTCMLLIIHKWPMCYSLGLRRHLQTAKEILAEEMDPVSKL